MRGFITGALMICMLSGLAGCQGAALEQPPGQPAHKSMITHAELVSALNYQLWDQRKGQGAIVSGVVPHHLTADHLTARYFDRLADQDPELLVIVGPNHNNRGARIITGRYNWQTPEGTVLVDQQAVTRLMLSNLAAEDDGTLAMEHSIGNLVPFVRHFLPETRIVPIILHHDVNLEEVDRLIGVIEEVADNAVVVASVDFSHYLISSEAAARDTQTLNYMRNADYVTLFRLGDEHLDSPPALASAFRWAEKRGAPQFEVMDHTNSGIMIKNEATETTSYFTLVFAVDQG